MTLNPVQSLKPVAYALICERGRLAVPTSSGCCEQVRHVNALGQCLAQSEHLVIVTAVVLIILTCQDHSELRAGGAGRAQLSVACSVTLSKSLSLSGLSFP